MVHLPAPPGPSFTRLLLRQQLLHSTFTCAPHPPVLPMPSPFLSLLLLLLQRETLSLNSSWLASLKSPSLRQPEVELLTFALLATFPLKRLQKQVFVASGTHVNVSCCSSYFTFPFGNFIYLCESLTDGHTAGE